MRLKHHKYITPRVSVKNDRLTALRQVDDHYKTLLALDAQEGTCKAEAFWVRIKNQLDSNFINEDVTIGEDCCEYINPDLEGGYLLISITLNKRHELDPSKGKVVKVPGHQLALYLYRPGLNMLGKENLGKEVGHCCRNRHCCNPNHLNFETHSHNVREAILTGRPKKVMVGHDIVKDAKIMDFDGFTCKEIREELSERYARNIPYATIWNIVNRKTFWYITVEYKGHVL